MKAEIYSNLEISSDIILPYRIYIPEKYSADKAYPLMIFMHGAGERGNDNKHLHSIDANRYFYYILEDEKLKNEFILIAPQCASDCRWVEHDWSESVYDFNPEEQLSVPLKLFYDLLENEIFVKYNIDMDRLLMTGISMGGFATWFTMMLRPQFLAAAVPVCGGADPKTAESIKNIPMRIFHSDDDPVVPSDSFHAMKKALESCGARDFGATLYTDEGHGSWKRAYLERAVFDWFISKHKNK